MAKLKLTAEIALEGRPVAIATPGQRLVILERPPGDDKHLAPGWWETFSLDGSSRGARVPAGYYPDDLAVTPDGRFLLVLSSGRAEGDKKKPLPGLDVFEVTKAVGWPCANTDRSPGPGAEGRRRPAGGLGDGRPGAGHAAESQEVRGD